MQKEAILTWFVCVLLTTNQAQAQHEPGRATGPAAPIHIVKDLAYTDNPAGQLSLDVYQEGNTNLPQPVIIWLPELGIKSNHDARKSPLSPESKFPTPVSFYVGYQYTVVAMEFGDEMSKETDILHAITYLTQKAKEWNLNLADIACIQPLKEGCRVKIIRKGGQAVSSGEILVKTGSDDHSPQFFSEKNTETIISFLHKEIGGGAYNPGFKPALMTVPDTSWIDPIMVTPSFATYQIYPTPSGGRNSYGSFMIYLPKGYQNAQNKRYPVIYSLHGGNGNQRNGEWLMKIMDKAIEDGLLTPLIVVSVQALPIGWYCNANTSAPGVISGNIEDEMIRDLIPYIDTHYRTIANHKGRGLEGWSMGGFGAIRLAFKYPEMFGYASSLAGALIDYKDEHNPQYLTNTFGPNQEPYLEKSIAFFNAVHPRLYAKQNAETIKRNVAIRLLVGTEDWLYDNNGKLITWQFSDYLTGLGIKHEYTVIEGVGHMLPEAFDQKQVEYPLQFWIDAFKMVK